MAYNVTGTAGNDVLNQQSDTGPGTIVGLAGDDCIFQGTGSAQSSATRATTRSCCRPATPARCTAAARTTASSPPATAAPMQLFGNEGADTVDTGASSAAQTIVGGDNSSDGADTILAGSGADLVFGNGGNDTVERRAAPTRSTAASATIRSRRAGPACISATRAQTRINVNPSPAGDTVVRRQRFGGRRRLRRRQQFKRPVFGNGGNDTVNSAGGADTAIGGFGNDDVSVLDGGLVFGNEGNDTSIGNASPPTTVFGGLGNDSIAFSLFNSQNLFVGGEGADTIVAGNANQRATIYGGVDSTAGGGADGADSSRGGSEPRPHLRRRRQRHDPGRRWRRDHASIRSPAAAATTCSPTWTAADDGNNAAGGGPLELVTDVDWSEDRFDTADPGDVRRQHGRRHRRRPQRLGQQRHRGGVRARRRRRQPGGGAVHLRRPHLPGDQPGWGAQRVPDTGDLLLDITGVTGTIATAISSERCTVVLRPRSSRG